MPDNPGEIDFPSNSKRKRLERPDSEGPKPEGEIPNRKLEKMITGEIVKKKKNILDRFSETFFGDDAANVGQFVLHDVLVPSIKNTVVEMIKSGAEMLFFGETKGSRMTRDRDRSIVSYGAYFKDEVNRNRRADPRDRDRVRGARARYDFDDITIPKRSEADLVLSALVDLIDEYGQASVADFYSALGVSSEYVDNHWGWEKLNMATVERARNGWYINLPNPVELD